MEARSKKQSPRAAVPVGPLGALGASVVRKLSDESLLAGLGSGDPDAAADFVRRFQRRVFGLTFSILRDQSSELLEGISLAEAAGWEKSDEMPGAK